MNSKVGKFKVLTKQTVVCIRVVCELSVQQCELSGQLFAGGTPSTLTARSLISLPLSPFPPNLLSLFQLHTPLCVEAGDLMKNFFPGSLEIIDDLKL